MIKKYLDLHSLLLAFLSLGIFGVSIHSTAGVALSFLGLLAYLLNRYVDTQHQEVGRFLFNAFVISILSALAWFVVTRTSR